MSFFKKNRYRYSVALIVSLVLHFFTFGYIYHVSKEKNNIADTSIVPKPAYPHAVKFDSVKMISQRELKEIKNRQNKQIVANELSGERVKPENSRFQGEADQRFDRQTQASINGSFKNAGLGNKAGNVETPLLQKKVASTPLKSTHANRNSKTSPRALTLSDLGGIQIQKISELEKIEANKEKELEQLVASEKVHSQTLGVERGDAGTTGLAKNNDFIEEVPLGDMTNLNTTEFKYYGFYHRIKQKLEQHWGSSIQSKARNLYKSGRRLPASENLITDIAVTIDDKGNIVDIKINGTSGIRDLDQAAVESFNKAGPFPNPPKGLMVDGRAVIQWGFVVKG